MKNKIVSYSRGGIKAEFAPDVILAHFKKLVF